MESNPTTAWGLLLSVALFLAGKAWSYVQGRLDGNQKAELSTAEGWAKKAAAWAMITFPGLDADTLTNKGMEELRKILSNVGIKPDDATWNHLSQVVHDFIITQFLARQNSKMMNGVSASPAAGTISTH